MLDDSTNLQMPWFEPSWPIYPHVRQIIRVTGQAGAVYNGWVQQWSDKINNFRDREPCYIYEPNGIALPNAIFRGRLCGAFTGSAGTLPIFVVSLACCVPPTSVSSSSISVSSPSPTSVSSSVRSVSSPSAISVSPASQPSIASSAIAPVSASSSISSSSVSSSSSPSSISQISVSVSPSSVSAISVSAASVSSSSFSCCNLQGQQQLGLFLVCPPPVSASSVEFNPGGGNGPGTNPPCPYCAARPDGSVPTPTSWSFESDQFFQGIFQCFKGLWTMIQGSADAPCQYTSDPADPCVAKFTINADCTVQLTLTVRGGNQAIYKGQLPACDCCSPLKLDLTLETQPGCPDVLTLTPSGCISSPTPSSISSMSPCVCQPGAVCLTQQGDGSFIGVNFGASWQLICEGTGPNGYVLLVTINGQTFTYQAQPGSTCSPFNILFFNVLGTCGEWQVTVNTNTAPCSSSSSSSPSSKSPSPSSKASVSSISSSSPSPTGTVATNCCPNLMPATLKVTFTGGTGTCTCLNGVVATVTNLGGGSNIWQGSVMACSTTVLVTVSCIAQVPGFVWAIVIGAGGPTNVATSSSCSPVDFIFNNASPAAAVCSGTINAEATIA